MSESLVVVTAILSVVIVLELAWIIVRWGPVIKGLKAEGSQVPSSASDDVPSPAFVSRGFVNRPFEVSITWPELVAAIRSAGPAADGGNASGSVIPKSSDTTSEQVEGTRGSSASGRAPSPARPRHGLPHAMRAFSLVFHRTAGASHEKTNVGRLEPTSGRDGLYNLLVKAELPREFVCGIADRMGLGSSLQAQLKEHRNGEDPLQLHMQIQSVEIPSGYLPANGDDVELNIRLVECVKDVKLGFNTRTAPATVVIARPQQETWE